MWKMCRQTKQRYVLPCAVQSGDSADSTNQFVKNRQKKMVPFLTESHHFGFCCKRVARR